MATAGDTRDVSTTEFCEFLHSPCWLYPMIRFFGHVIDEYGYNADFAYFETIDQKKTMEKFKTIYESYCDLVGCILVAYHKDQGVELADVIKTAALLCTGNFKPAGVVRQDVVNFLQAALKVEYFSYTMMCYNNMFEILSCHDMKSDIMQKNDIVEEKLKLLGFVHGMMEYTFEEHRKVEEYFESLAMKLPSLLHIGPFLCFYGISLCDPKYNYDSNLGKQLSLMNQALNSTVNRHQRIEYLSQILANVKVDEKKVDKNIKKETADIPPSSVDVNAAVKKMKASILKASLDYKLTIDNKIFAINCDHQYQLAVLDIRTQQHEVLTSDKFKDDSNPPEKPLLPEERVALPQAPSEVNPPRALRGVWPQGKPSQMVHLMKEYNHRVTENIAYLVIPFLVQANVENRCELKIVVERYAKTFEDEWPDTAKMKSNRHRGYSHPPSEEAIKESRDAIELLKSYTKLDQ